MIKRALGRLIIEFYMYGWPDATKWRYRQSIFEDHKLLNHYDEIILDEAKIHDLNFMGRFTDMEDPHNYLAEISFRDAFNTWYDTAYPPQFEGSPKLTPQERQAIRSVRLAAAFWTPSLWLYSASGSLLIMKRKEDGSKAVLPNGSFDPAYIITKLPIPNDGGDF